MSISDDPSPDDSSPDHSSPDHSSPADSLEGSLSDAVARLRQGIILAFIALLAISIGSMVLAFMSRSDIAALQGQVAALAASAAAVADAQPGSAQPTPQTEPGDGASRQPGVAEPMRIQSPVPRGADEFGALLIGNRGATSIVESFVDFQCPFCQRWDQELGDALISRALAEGSNLLIKVNPLAFLGETSADLSVPGASARAANAAACIAEYEEPMVLAGFIAAVYEAADPREPPGQFPPSQLVRFAADAGAGTQTTECIRTRKFISYIAEITRNSFVRGVTGTPTVILDGTLVQDPFRSRELIALAANPNS